MHEELDAAVLSRDGGLLRLTDTTKTAQTEPALSPGGGKVAFVDGIQNLESARDFEPPRLRRRLGRIAQCYRLDAKTRACQLAASDAWLRSFIGAPIWRCDQTLSNGWPTRLPGWQSTPRRGRSSTPGRLKSGGCRTGGRIMLKQIQSILNSLLTGALVSLNLASPGTPRST